MFFFDKFGIRYGTDDKKHAASLIISFLSALILLSCLIIGVLVCDRGFVIEIAKIAGSVFLFSTGVAIGSSKSGETPEE